MKNSTWKRNVQDPYVMSDVFINSWSLHGYSISKTSEIRFIFYSKPTLSLLLGFNTEIFTCSSIQNTRGIVLHNWPLIHVFNKHSLGAFLGNMTLNMINTIPAPSKPMLLGILMWLGHPKWAVLLFSVSPAGLVSASPTPYLHDLPTYLPAWSN